jgi:acyl transferase domain-containing protein
MVARGELSAAQAMSLIRNVRAETVGTREASGVSERQGAVWPPVAVVGIAGRFAGAGDVEQFWQNLRAGRPTTREVPPERWSVERFYDTDTSRPGTTNCKWGGFLEGFDLFDPLFFNISPKEAELMDPQQRLFLTEAWKALEDAGYAGDDARGKPWGVFVGAGGGDYVHRLSAAGIPLDGYAFMGNSSAILAARIAYLLDLKGPCLTVDTACSSSLTAIHLACESIALGTSELAIAGGVCALTTPNFYLAGSKTGMLSPRGECRTFDQEADGFVPGEAVGVVVLKSLERASRDGDFIYGVIEGSAINQDGKTNGITAPSAPSQTALELEVYEKFNVSPDTIGYVETHGTGTKLGDPIEIEALTRAFRQHTDRRQFCAVGSVKTNLGHTMTAGGIVSVLKVLLALKHCALPPSLNFTRANEAIDFAASPFYVNQQLLDWQPTGATRQRRAAVSSFGFSGTNVHMVIAEAPPVRAPESRARSLHLITLSARTETALRKRCAELAECARLQSGAVNMTSVSFSLNVGRSHFDKRLAFVVRDSADLVGQLQQHAHAAASPGGSRPVAQDTTKHLPAAMLRRLLEQLRDAANDLADDYKNGLLLLAESYVSGQEIPWSRLYREDERRRIPLPAYPFDEQPYMVAEQSAAKLPAGLHPLLDRVKLTTRGLVFHTTLEKSMPVLRDHVVKGNSILPGVALMEMARAAGDALEDKAGVERLEDIFFLRPLIVGDEPQLVTLRLRAGEDSGADRMSFEIAADGTEQLVYCRGSLVFRREAGTNHDEPRAAARVDLKAIESRCREATIESSSLYAAFAEAGVECGAFCRGVRRIMTGAAEALGELVLPAGELRGPDYYNLHPALMDGAFQTAMALHARATTSIMVPFSVAEMEIYAPLAAHCYAYVQRSPDEQRTGEARFNIAILSDSGRVLVRIKNFCAREFAPSGALSQKPKESSQSRAEVVSNAHDEPLTYYQPVWIERPLEAKPTPPGETVLIFSRQEDLGLSDALAEAYASRIVLQVQLGEEYRSLAPGKFEINHRHQGDYERLIERLKHIDEIYFLGGLQNPSMGSISIDALAEAEEYGVLSLLRLAHALPRRKKDLRPLRLKVVTNDVQAVREGETVAPLAAAVIGFTKTLSREYRDVLVSLIDVRAADVEAMRECATTEAAWLLQALRVEAANPPGLEISLRAGRRYVKALRRVTPNVHALTPSFRENGFYLLAGGAGGLGHEVARFLAANYRARLLILGRSELDDARLAQMRELESQGACVSYERVDVADEDALGDVLAAARERWGKVDGVVHAAMVLQDRMLATLDEQTCRDVLRPKTRGSLALARAVEADAPDFFAFFSSANSHFGNAGQGNYAAASTFQDAFAIHLAERHGVMIKLFNWGFWGEVGAVATPAYRQRVMSHGVGSIGCGEGIEAFRRVVTSGNLVQVMPIKISGDTLSKMGILLAETDSGERAPAREDPTATALHEALTSAQAESSTSRGEEAGGLASGTRASVEQTLREQLAFVVKLAPYEIRADKPFSEYGVDSIMGADLVQKINLALGLELRATVLFDYSCLTDLTVHVLAEGGPRVERVRHQPREGNDAYTEPGELFQSTDELFKTATASDLKDGQLDELLRQLAAGQLDAESAYERLVLATAINNGKHHAGVRS